MQQINDYIENNENIEDSICKANFCLGEKAIKNFNGYCKHCFVNLFPTHPITIQASCKTKEQVVRKFINTNFDGFLHNKPIWTGNCDCTHRRKIDHRKLIGNTLLCIETDEKQHKGYTKKYDDFGNLDEEIRYDDIAMVHGGKFIFIRFNPDKFTNHKGVKINPILYLRLHKLKNEINKQIERIINDENDDLIEIIYLYYDNYNDEDNNNDTNSNNINVNNIAISNNIIDELYIIKDNIISNNLHEILSKTKQSYYQRFICYKCFYTSKKKYNIKIHLLDKKKSCNRNSLCIYSDDDITKLNVKQFKYSDIFLNTLQKITQKILNNLRNYIDLYQCKFRFICYKCFFGTNIKNDILNHFNKENICYKHPCCTDSNEKIEYLNINQLNKYYSNDINLIDEKPYLRHFKCYRCNFTHNKKYNVQSHLARKTPCKKDTSNCLTDKEIDILNKNQFIKEKNNTILIQNNNIQNNNIQNQTINNNLTIKLISFDKDWDLSHIPEKELQRILFSTLKYTTFYKDILKNNINSNIIIDKKSETGRVFNDNEEYDEIELNSIIEKTMTKLHKQLNDIFENTQNEFYQTYKKDDDKNINLLIKLFDEIKLDLDVKLNDFKEKNLVKKHVINEFSKILEDNQEKALEFLKNKNKECLQSGY